MSKLSRKEFKELLLEWNKSTINERDFKSLNVPGWSEVSDDQEEIVKSVNFPATMLNFPVPNRLLRVKPNKKLYKIFQNRFSIFPKNEKNYNLIKNAIKDFYKTVVLNPKVYNKSLLGDYEEGVAYEPVYNKENITFNATEGVDKERVLENIDRLFEEKKDLLTGKDKEDNVPCFVYLTKLFSDYESMAEGGLFKVSELPEDVSSSFLKWLFHHDFFHVLEMYSNNRIGKQIKDKKRASLDKFELLDLDNIDNIDVYRSIKIKGLEGSLGSNDNFSSVMPYILTKSQEEAKDFLEENYVSYDEYMEFISDHIGEFSEADFLQEKNQSIDTILKHLVVFKNNFKVMFDELKDCIIIASYEISGSKTIEIEDLPSADDPSSSKYAVVNFGNISEDNLDRIIDYAIKTQNGNLIYSINLNNWSRGICSKKSQKKLINMDISNKASFDFTDFEGNETVNGKAYIVLAIVKRTKYQDVVELACEKYYNSHEIENGEFVKVFRKVVEEYWPQVDTSKFLEESILKNYISLIIS